MFTHSYDTDPEMRFKLEHCYKQSFSLKIIMCGRNKSFNKTETHQ